MYDLNIPISFGENGNKKGKGKQTSPTEVRYTPAQISVIESRIDMLSHCMLGRLSQHAIYLTTAESGIQRDRLYSNRREKSRPKDACQHIGPPSRAADIEKGHGISQKTFYNTRRGQRERVWPGESQPFTHSNMHDSPRLDQRPNNPLQHI